MREKTRERERWRGREEKRELIREGRRRRRRFASFREGCVPGGNEIPAISFRAGGHATFPAVVKPRRLISFIPRVVSTNYELTPAIIKKYNFAARAALDLPLNALTISYPARYPRRYAEAYNGLKYSPSRARLNCPYSVSSRLCLLRLALSILQFYFIRGGASSSCYRIYTTRPSCTRALVKAIYSYCNL